MGGARPPPQTPQPELRGLGYGTMKAGERALSGLSCILGA